MSDISQWVNGNTDELTRRAIAELSQDATHQSQAASAIADFFMQLAVSLQTDDLTPLYTLLKEWVWAGRVSIEDDTSYLLPVVIKLRQVCAAWVYQQCEVVIALDYIYQLDNVFDALVLYTSALETDAVMQDARGQVHQAQAALERLNKSKSDFVEVAAHELRTPITLVEGYTNMLRTQPEMAENAQVQALVEGIDGGVKRLREIIRDMLDVSLISLGMIELYLQPVWIAHILQALEHNMHTVLRQRNMELVIAYDTLPDEPILADPERLLQVFQKIVTNAIKYTPDNRKVHIHARQFPGFLDVMVADDGIGIDAENLSRIFEMFSSLGDSSLHSSGKVKFRGGGPGLGLYISKGIMDAHGGNIWAESPGYSDVEYPGSTFHIMIPMRTMTADDRINP